MNDLNRPLACVINLGCVKNLVDSEILLHELTRLGYQLSPDPKRAAVIVVNTCGFLESAVEEAIDTLLEASAHKQSGQCRHLVAAGCMVQRYGKKLPDLLPEVDLFLGTSFYHRFRRIFRAYLDGDDRRVWISRPDNRITHATGRVLSTPFHTAYVKIAEGCSNHCSFCMIPHLRGPYRSRSIADIVQEATRLAADGVREINLVAQDTTAYGRDREPAESLPELLRQLERVPELAWIRILYAHPEHFDGDLPATMAASAKIVPYLDIPLQHCVPHILQAMHRGSTHPDPRELLTRIRQSVPDLAIRTSLMVGFPGESEADFEALLDFVDWARFDHLGVFIYSPEPGSRAARYPDRVPADTAERRRHELMERQRSISRAKLDRYIGTIQPVLVEGPHPETDLLVQGRLPTQAPEVDGSVMITEGACRQGHILPVRILAAHDYDLEGVVIDPTTAANRLNGAERGSP